MSDSKQNEGKKARMHQEETDAGSSGIGYIDASKHHKEQQHKQVKADLNPQEDGDENSCSDDKSNIEPENGSVCEFQ